jgi:hypothetical protein
MIGNVVDHAFDVKSAVRLFPPAQEPHMPVFAPIWKPIGVEQKRWRKE